MGSPPSRGYSLVLLFSAVAFLLLAAGNWDRGLFEPSEGRYGSIAAEMLRSGDFLVPRLNGMEHFEKPPLASWAMAGSMWLFGETEGALRLPGVLAGLVCLGCAYLMAGGRRADRAWLAPALTLASPLFFGCARTVTTDIYLAAFAATTLLCVLRFQDESRDARSRSRWLTLAALTSALGFLTKGPVIWILTLVPMLAEMAWSRRLRELRAVFHPFRVLLFLAVASSWFVVVCLQRPGLLQWFLRERVTGALTSSEDFHSGPIYYFLPVFLLGLLPAGVIFLGAGREAFARTLGGRSERLLLCAVVIPFVTFSLSASKLASYILPVAVPVAVLAVPLLDESRVRRGVATAAVLLGVVVLGAAGAGLAKGVFQGMPVEPRVLLALAGTAGLVASVAAGRALRRGSPDRGTGMLVGGQLAALLFVILALPGAEAQVVRRAEGREIAQAAGRLAADGRPIVCYRNRGFIRSLPFYTGRRVLLLDRVGPSDTHGDDDSQDSRLGAAGLAALLDAGPVAFVTREDYRERLEGATGKLFTVATLGRFLVLSNVPEDAESEALQVEVPASHSPLRTAH